MFHGWSFGAFWGALLGFLTSLLAVFGAGCAQNTEAPVDQIAGQELITPTITEQQAATDGPRYNFYFASLGADTEPNWLWPDAGTNGELPRHIHDLKNESGTMLATAHGGVLRADGGIHITITGDMTPSLTGTTTGTASGTQQPVASPTASPVQDIRSRVSAAIPIAVAPGGIASPQATAGAGEGNVEATKSDTHDLRWAEVKALADQLQQLMPLFEQLFGGTDPPGGTGQPAVLPREATTQPAE